MEKKLRLRGPNFTKSENLLLCDIVTQFKHIIENKKTDSGHLQQKHKAWQEVVQLYNFSTTGCQRTLESLQQNYKNLKKKLKKKAMMSDPNVNNPVKRKLESEVPQVFTKFSSLASEKLSLVALQKELIQCQLTEEKEKLEHNRLLRAMEIEDAKKHYEHKRNIRQLELDFK